MQEIFDLQWRLNAYTLKNIGVDYARTVQDPELKVVWIENYRKAFSAELAELVREVEEHGIGTQNGKIELVDLLHFLVSLSHLVRVEPHEVALAPSSSEGLSFQTLVLRAFLGLDDLQNSLKWKWWAKGGGYKPEKARAAVLELWKCFEQGCTLFGMDFHATKDIYIAKNRVNVLRQDRHYNEDTKTEADNQAIKV